MKYSLPLCMVLGVAGTACGSAPPREALTAAEASVRAAEVGGADETPKASLYLKHARDQVAAARALIEDGDNDRAAMTLDRALVDAEVALAQARREKAKAEAQEVIDEVEQLKQRLKGKA